MATESNALENAGGDLAGGDEGHEGLAPEILQQASEMGWVPKEKFRGDPDRWVDADEFVRKGEEVLPLVRAGNRRLQEQLIARDADLAEANRKLNEMQESIKAINEIQNREALGRVNRQIQSVRRQIEEARSERDTDKVLELTETLETLEGEKALVGKPVAKEAEEEETPRTAIPQAQLQAELQDWQQENEWFGKDRMKTRVANAIAAEIREDPAFRGVVGRKFLEEVSKRTEEAYSEAFPSGEGRRQVGKTAGGSQSGARAQGTGTRRGKSYADLPQEARAACDADASRLVGPNRVYKTAADYQAFYVKEYFGDEA